MIQQGEIYLVNFAKKYNSEFGKIRPAVVIQNNFLNKAIQRNNYQSVLVVPMSTLKIEDDYRLKISSRDNLKEDNYCVANWICTLDIDRFSLDKGILTTLDSNELEILKSKICNVM